LTDPRLSVIEERLKGIDEIIAIASGKGGVGKSLVASVLALTLARDGNEVGLLDLDFTGPSTHIILGVKGIQPTEDRGVLPPVVHGLKYMSITYYSGESPVPLRGVDTSNALIELLSVTRWGALDFLVLDMPPGIGDATLDLLRLVRRIRFVVVTTPSQLAFETVRKLIALLEELKVPVVGIVENMKTDSSDSIQRRALEIGTRFLGEIPYDPEVESAIGDVGKLMGTRFTKAVEQIRNEMHL
jgi:ATP-binding protein involved in chromosome partitioning